MPKSVNEKPTRLASCSGSVLKLVKRFSACSRSARNVYVDVPWSAGLVAHRDGGEARRHPREEDVDGDERSAVACEPVPQGRAEGAEGSTCRAISTPIAPCSTNFVTYAAILRQTPCRCCCGVPYTTSWPSPSFLRSRGISSGGCWRSSSMVMTTSQRALRMPASKAFCCPWFRIRRCRGSSRSAVPAPR